MIFLGVNRIDGIDERDAGRKRTKKSNNRKKQRIDTKKQLLVDFGSKKNNFWRLRKSVNLGKQRYLLTPLRSTCPTCFFQNRGGIFPSYVCVLFIWFSPVNSTATVFCPVQKY